MKNTPQQAEHEYYHKEPTPMMYINELSKLFGDIMRREQDSANLQNSYRNLLFHLVRQDGCTQLHLAKMTHLKAPTVSVTLQKMERDGYVARVSDENDLRQTLVYLTPKGREYNDKMHRKIFEIEDTVMAAITPEETAQVTAILKKMRQNIFDSTLLNDNCTQE